jgi:hypothetical protein
MADLAAALSRRFPASRSAITYCPDAALQALLASHPPLMPRTADSLGFRHDVDLDRLVANSLIGPD